MHRSKLLIFVFIFLLLGIATTTNALVSSTENQTPCGVSIIRAEFGLFNSTKSGEQAFVPTRTVPLIENQGYGWIILLETKKTKIKWREEFTLPTAPEIWGGAVTQGSQSISKDKRVSIMERDVEPVRGLIYNTWAVAPGDPKGRYIIRVVIENRLEQVFEFELK